MMPGITQCGSVVQLGPSIADQAQRSVDQAVLGVEQQQEQHPDGHRRGHHRQVEHRPEETLQPADPLSNRASPSEMAITSGTCSAV